MRLYKMELYKICRKKILWVVGALMIAWMCFYFLAEVVGSEQTMVEGVTYYGYEAIQRDLEITKEYEGILTDTKVGEMIQKYGFPTEVVEEVGWKDVNYLTEFVTDYLSDGYLQDWNDYRLPKHTIPLGESQLKEYMEPEQGGIPFGYTKGWIKFYDFFDTGVELILVWLIIALAPLFCEERQLKMYPLIFTSEHGKSKDVWGKIAAAFSLALIVYLIFVFVSFLLFQKTFGILNLTMPAGLVLEHAAYYGITLQSIQTFAGISCFKSLLAVLMMTSICVWVSSAEKTAFGSILIALFIFCMPIVLQMTFPGRLVYLLDSSQPFFLANHRCLIETWSLFGVHIVTACAVILAGIGYGSRTWRKVEMC